MAPTGYQGSDLVDLSTGEALLLVDHVSKDQLADFGTHLLPARLGQVSGYEFLPNLAEVSVRDNFWIVCEGQGSCLRLRPLSEKNPKVFDIVGGLKAREAR